MNVDQALAINADGEWGQFDPNQLRIEIERGGWDVTSITGWGPGMPLHSRYALTQRAEPSPHPLTWHSRFYDTAEEARIALVEREIDRELASDRDLRLLVPGVSHLAFAFHHHNVFEGCTRTSVAECPGKRCIEEALTHIRCAAQDASIVLAAINYLEAGDASPVPAEGH